MIIECFYILFLFSSGVLHSFLSLFFFHLLLFWCYGYLYDTWIPNMLPGAIIRIITLQFYQRSIQSKHLISLQKKCKLIILLKSNLENDKEDLKTCLKFVNFLHFISVPFSFIFLCRRAVLSFNCYIPHSTEHPHGTEYPRY